MKKNKTKKIIIVAVSIIIVIFMGVFIVYHQVSTKLSYCKNIGMEMGWLNLEQFKCCSITEKGDNNDEICFLFKLQPFTDYNEKEGYKDVIKAKEVVRKYLKDNPDNELNNRKITLRFNTYADEYIYVKNYTSTDDLQTIGEFAYYGGFYVPLSDSEKYSDARTITLMLDENDDVSVLEKWNNLEYLNISGNLLTEEQQKYLSEILPNCTLAYNWNTFYAPTTDKEFE